MSGLFVLNRNTFKGFFQRRNGTSISVLLLENVVNRGEKGEIVKVKRGYFRNLLYPRKLATYPTPENLIKYKYIILEREQRKNEENSQPVKQSEVFENIGEVQTQ